jgi:hypothetical protein
MNRRSLPRTAALLLAALGTVVACYGSEPSAPSMRAPGTPSALRGPGAGNGGTNSAPAASPARGTPHLAACTPRDSIVSSGVFGPAGGTLIVGGSRLIIPGGALLDTVTITATARGDSTSEVDFEPSGLHFAKPAGLVLDGTGCGLDTADTPSVVYVAPDGTIIETIDAFYDPHWRAVAAPIEHFSGYAIAF